MPDISEHYAVFYGIFNVAPGTPNFEISLKWDDVRQAKQHLAAIRIQQKELRLLKKSIALDIRDIRAEATNRRAQVGRPGVGDALMRGIFGGRAVGRLNRSSRGDIHDMQQQSLAPYETLQRTIDTSLSELERFKIELDRWILKNQT